MLPRFLSLLLVLIVWSVGSPCLKAASYSIQDSVPSVRGLVIGISDYEDKEIQDLQFAHQDALNFVSLLKDVFPQIQSKVLVDEAAVYDSIIIALTSILTQAQKGDTLVLYFSGHGDCETKLFGEPGFLLTYDTPEHNYLLRALRLSDLKNIVETLAIKKQLEVILFMDACRAGLTQEDGYSGPGKTMTALMKLFERQLLFLSCKPDQYSIEKSHLEGGLFTHFLLKGMAGLADQDGNGYLGVEELRRYLYDQVMYASAGGQTPMVTGDPVKIILSCPSNSPFLDNQQPSRVSNMRRPTGKVKAKPMLPSTKTFEQDSIGPGILKERFQKALEDGRILQPSTSCAFHYYKKYLSEKGRNIEDGMLMKTRLMLAVRKAVTTGVRRYIEGERLGLTDFTINRLLSLLNASLKLLTSNDIQYSYFDSNRLFLEALRYPLAEYAAVDLLQEAIEIEAFAAYMHNELGNQYRALDRNDLAIDSYVMARSISPKWTLPRRNLQALERESITNPMSANQLENRKIWAVIVGVANYRQMQPLRYTDDDASTLYAFLKSPEGGALPDEQIQLLLDESATHNDILGALASVSRRAAQDDLIIFYFAGYGVNGAFLPIDYDGFNNQLLHLEIKSLLATSRAKQKLIIADACHSADLMGITNNPGLIQKTIQRYYETFEEASPGVALLMSSKDIENSLESKGRRQGIFSHFLIKGLKGESDRNRNRIVELQEISEYLRAGVASLLGNNQVPTLSGTFDRRMPVAVIRE